MSVLRLDGVRKAYGAKTVLRDVDLVVEPHDVVCLIGASGSGKSTLLRCVNLLERVDDGQIFFGDEDITDPRVDVRGVRRRMGMVFQAYNLFPHMSVLENLTLAPRIVQDVGAERARVQALEMLERFGLADKAGRIPTSSAAASSSGSRWRGRWSGRPELLLLDEVTSAFDPELVGEMLTVLRDLAAEGTTMVLATHEMAFARDVANQVCYLHDGAILEHGSPAEVLGAPQQERTRQFLARVL